MTETPVQEWEFNPKEILASTRKVQGIFHQPVVDKDGELITPKGMREAVPDFMHLPALHDFHKERPVGLATKVKELSGGRFWFEGVIKSTADCDDIWEKVKTGNYDQVSIFGKRTKYNNQCSLPQNMRSGTCITDGVRLDSISVCDENARNPQTSLEVKKAKVVFDAETIGKQWGRDSEGNFVEIVKADNEGKKGYRESIPGSMGLVPIDKKRQKKEGNYWEKKTEEKKALPTRDEHIGAIEDAKESNEKRRRQDAIDRGVDPDYGKNPKKRKKGEINKADDEVDKARSYDTPEEKGKQDARVSIARYPGQEKMKQKEAAKLMGDTQKAETTVATTKNRLQTIDRFDERQREIGGKELGYKNMSALANGEKNWIPKAETTSSNLQHASTDYAGGKVRITKKCGEKCIKQEPNTISKDVEKAGDYEDQHGEFKEETSPTRKSPHAVGVTGQERPKVLATRGRYDQGSPKTEHGHTVFPPKTEGRSGHEGGIKRVGTAPPSETRELENSGAAVDAIRHYEVQASRNKFSGDIKETEHKQAHAKTGHRLGGAVKKGRPTITEEPAEGEGTSQNTRDDVKEIPVRRKQSQKDAIVQKGDEMEDEMEKGIRIVDADEDDKKTYAEQRKEEKPGYKKPKPIKKGDDDVEKGKHTPRVGDTKTFPDGKTGVVTERSKQMEKERREKLGAEGLKNLHKGDEEMEKSAAEDLEDESYDEDEDSDFDKVKQTDKEQNWSKTKGADCTPGLKKSGEDQEDEGDHNSFNEDYGEEGGTWDEPMEPKKKVKKAQEKGKPEEDDEEQDEDDEEEEDDVEKGKYHPPYKTAHAGRGAVTPSERDDVGREQRTYREVNKERKKSMFDKAKKEEPDTDDPYINRKMKQYYDHEDEKPKKTVKKSKGDEDTASESFNPSTVTKGEQMDEYENDVEYVTKALVPIEEIDTIVKARTEEISKAYMGQLEEIKKAYDVKFVELSSKIEKMENETIRKGGQVIVIPELLGGSTGGSMSNADALARMQAGR